MGVFGSKKSTKEILRENKRLIKRAIRELQRERKAMEKHEKTLIKDIKKNAKINQIASVRIMAKDLVRTRNFVKKFHKMEAQMNTVSMQLQMMKSTDAMNTAMKGVTKAMIRMNKQMNMPKMRKIMQEFVKQNELIEMKQEMTDDMMDSALGEEDDEEESDKIVSQVLDEIGVDFAGMVPDAPDQDPATANQTAAQAAPAAPTAVPMGGGGGGGGGGGDDPPPAAPSGGGGGGGGADPQVDDLMARLNNLKK